MALFTGTPHTLRTQLVRSAIAGVVCGALEWALFLAFVHAGELVWSATTWAALCSILLNYLLSVHWVFRNRNVRRQWLELKLFLIIGISGLGLNVFATTTLHDRCGASPLLAKAAASVLVVIWAFTGKKVMLFSDRGSTAPEGSGKVQQSGEESGG